MAKLPETIRPIRPITPLSTYQKPSSLSSNYDTKSSNPTRRISEPNNHMRRSFTGNPFSKPSSLKENPISNFYHTPSNSPIDFSRKRFAYEQGNVKDHVLRPSKIRSPSPAAASKLSNNFMCPTTSASFKVVESPRRQILTERNETALSSEHKIHVRKVTFTNPLEPKKLDASIDGNEIPFPSFESDDMSSENLSVSDAGSLFPRDDLFKNVPMNSPSISHIMIHNNSLFENISIESLIPQNEIHSEYSFENVSIEPDFVNLDPTFKLSPTLATPPVSYKHTVVAYSNLQRSLTFESEHGDRYEPVAYRSDSQSSVGFPKNESSGSWHQEAVSVSLEATFTSDGHSYSARDGTSIGDPTVSFEQANFPSNQSVHPQEALRLIKYIVGKSGTELRRETQRHSVVIPQLLHYTGQPNPLKGDALNKAVWDTANKGISVMFSKDNDNEDSMDLDSQSLDPFIPIVDKNQNSNVCPSYFRWIHEDLKPWKDRGITREMLEGGRKTANFKAVIVDGKLYVEKYMKSFHTRDVFTLWSIVQLLRLFPGKLPDLELMFDCEDRPVIRSDEFQGPNASPPPLFGYCSDQSSLDIVFPDWSFWGWAEINIKPWNGIMKDIKEGNKRIKWKDRVPYAYWKGNPTVAATRNDLLTCNVTSENDWKNHIYIQDWAKETNEGYKESNLANQCTHRYKIYIEGIAWSVSEKYILACDSMTLYVRPNYYDFFMRGMVPLQNYWPIRDNTKCTSLKFAVEWGNNNTDKAQAIGKAASKFMQEDLAMNNIYDYMFHLLNGYAKLLRFKPTIPQGAEELCSETMACDYDGTHRKFMEESMVMSPSDSNPCTILPPYDSLTIQEILERKANSTRQVEVWEDEYWQNRNNGHSIA